MEQKQEKKQAVEFDAVLMEFDSPAFGLELGWVSGAKLWQPYLLLTVGCWGAGIGWETAGADGAFKSRTN